MRSMDEKFGRLLIPLPRMTIDMGWDGSLPLSEELNLYIISLQHSRRM